VFSSPLLPPDDAKCAAVVGIAADHADPASIAAMVAHLPNPEELCIIVLASLEPDGIEALFEQLGQAGHLARLATAEEPLEAGQLYVAPHGAQVSIRDHALRVSRAETTSERQSGEVAIRERAANTQLQPTAAPESELALSSVRPIADPRDFLAMLGHELRNPLAAIRNATELLAIDGLEPSELERIHAILDRQTHQMAKLIDGLLDVSRIVRGKLSLEKSTLDLVPLLRELLQERGLPGDQRTPLIALDLANAPLWVDGDAVRLRQIFESLLSNAIKFTPRRGEIAVRARIADDAVVVSVADNGVGIEPSLLPEVFEPFRQARQNVDRSLGGLGLGLTLVRGLVALHGGSTTAESGGRGLGSTFTVRLPLADEPTRPRSVRPRAVTGLRVLVIEDNDDLAETLAALLEIIGHEVLAVANTGSEGLERARALQPDLILCDIGLPGELDGLDVARAIRADAQLAHTRMIAVTGYGAPEDRERVNDAGFDACLIKPVELEQLQRHLAHSDHVS
jgi:two-component system CheB/CheR fusion protein